MKTGCGIDVHKDSVFCCIMHADGRKIQHKFGVLTEELQTMRTLIECEAVEEYAMFSFPLCTGFSVKFLNLTLQIL